MRAGWIAAAGLVLFTLAGLAMYPGDEDIKACVESMGWTTARCKTEILR